MTLEGMEIAVAVDYSEHASGAARMAESLARATGSPLVLLHVFEGHPEELESLDRVPTGFQGLVQLSDEELAQVLREGARKLFDRIRAELGPGDLEIREVSLDGDPADALLDYIDSHRNTLLVVGRRGLSRARSLLLGSVSERLVREAPCPVLVHR